LSQAFLRLYPSDKQFTNDGNIDRQYLSVILENLDARSYIWGHPANGALTQVADRVDIITMLRRPVDQAVSNYLHIRENPADRLSAEANRLSLSEFLRAHPHYIALQTLTIANAIRDDAAEIATDCDRCVKQVSDFLERAAFVGVLDRSTECCEVLSERFQAEFPARLPHLNSARLRGTSPDVMRALRYEYIALRESGQFAQLFAGEAAIYAKAADILLRRHKSLPRAASPLRAANNGTPPNAMPASLFSSPRGRLVDGKIICPAHSGQDHIIHGPYCCLAPGDYEVEFQFRSLDAPRFGLGFLRLDVVANNALRLSTRLLPEGGRPSAGRRTLRFTNEHHEDVLEFRIGKSKAGRGSLEFDGVVVRPLFGTRGIG